jgi:hypothetical protein
MSEITLEEYIYAINNKLGYAYIGHYKKDFECTLNELCDKYGSDKGELTKDGHPYNWPSHTYADYYASLFRHCRKYIKNVFECGIGTNNPNFLYNMGVKATPGASLRLWRDYFPIANIFGADIDRDILIEEDRIATFYVDQTDPKSIADLWRNIQVTEFDLMLDDGLHTFEGGKILFEHSINNLSEEGIYIIEDVVPQDLLLFKKYFSDKNFKVEYISLMRPGLPILSDNNLVVIRKS